MSFSEYPWSRYESGTYKRECDISGFDFLRSEMRKQWNGFIVSEKNFNERPREERPKRPRKTRTILIE